MNKEIMLYKEQSALYYSTATDFCVDKDYDALTLLRKDFDSCEYQEFLVMYQENLIKKKASQ